MSKKNISKLIANLIGVCAICQIGAEFQMEHELPRFLAGGIFMAGVIYAVIMDFVFMIIDHFVTG